LKCPKCRLENPPSTDVCDCGYSFSSGTYVPRPTSPSGQSFTASAELGRYAVLERIAKNCRIAGWIVAIVLSLIGAATLVNAPDVAKAVRGAIIWFLVAFAQLGTSILIAELISLAVDIANDVRVIAAKLTEYKP
jgi:hypothetical protein